MFNIIVIKIRKINFPINFQTFLFDYNNIIDVISEVSCVISIASFSILKPRLLMTHCDRLPGTRVSEAITK